MGETDTRTKHEEREQRILDATAMLIVRYGYDKTSVSDIAKEAGISKGAVYLHFDSKDTLIYRLIVRELLKFVQIWQDRMKTDATSSVFADMYRHLLTAMKANDFLWALFSQQRMILGANFANRQGSTIYQQRLGLSHHLLTQLKAVGAIRSDLNPTATAYIFNMLNYGYLRLGEVIPDDLAPPTDEVVKEIGDLIQRHLEPEGNGNPEEARRLILEFIAGAVQLVQQMAQNQ